MPEEEVVSLTIVFRWECALCGEDGESSMMVSFESPEDYPWSSGTIHVHRECLLKQIAAEL